MPRFVIRHSSALISAIEMMVETRQLKSGPGRTLQAIAGHWRPNSPTPFPSHDRLAAMTGVNRRTIVTHIEKLQTLGLITVVGKSSWGTLCYQFNNSALGRLFKAAKDALKAQGLKAAKKAARAAKAASKKAQKDHSGKSQNDHRKSINPNGLKQGVEKPVSAADGFLEMRIKALMSEITHRAKLKRKAAYDTAKLANQIARGERLSPQEEKRQQAKRLEARKRQKALEAQRSPIQAAVIAAENRMLSSGIAKLMGKKHRIPDEDMALMCKHPEFLSFTGKRRLDQLTTN